MNSKNLSKAINRVLAFLLSVAMIATSSFVTPVLADDADLEEIEVVNEISSEPASDSVEFTEVLEEGGEELNYISVSDDLTITVYNENAIKADHTYDKDSQLLIEGQKVPAAVEGSGTTVKLGNQTLVVGTDVDVEYAYSYKAFGGASYSAISDPGNDNKFKAAGSYRIEITATTKYTSEWGNEHSSKKTIDFTIEKANINTLDTTITANNFKITFEDKSSAGGVAVDSNTPAKPMFTMSTGENPAPVEVKLANITKISFDKTLSTPDASGDIAEGFATLIGSADLTMGDSGNATFTLQPGSNGNTLSAVTTGEDKTTWPKIKMDIETANYTGSYTIPFQIVKNTTNPYANKSRYGIDASSLIIPTTADDGMNVTKENVKLGGIIYDSTTGKYVEPSNIKLGTYSGTGFFTSGNYAAGKPDIKFEKKSNGWYMTYIMSAGAVVNSSNNKVPIILEFDDYSDIAQFDSSDIVLTFELGKVEASTIGFSLKETEVEWINANTEATVNVIVSDPKQADEATPFGSSSGKVTAMFYTVADDGTYVYNCEQNTAGGVELAAISSEDKRGTAAVLAKDNSDILEVGDYGVRFIYTSTLATAPVTAVSDILDFSVVAKDASFVAAVSGAAKLTAALTPAEDGVAPTGTVVVKNGGDILVANTDYKITYHQNTAVYKWNNDGTRPTTGTPATVDGKTNVKAWTYNGGTTEADKVTILQGEPYAKITGIGGYAGIVDYIVYEITPGTAVVNSTTYSSKKVPYEMKPDTTNSTRTIDLDKVLENAYLSPDTNGAAVKASSYTIDSVVTGNAFSSANASISNGVLKITNVNANVINTPKSDDSALFSFVLKPDFNGQYTADTDEKVTLEVKIKEELEASVEQNKSYPYKKGSTTNIPALKVTKKSDSAGTDIVGSCTTSFQVYLSEDSLTEAGKATVDTAVEKGTLTAKLDKSNNKYYAVEADGSTSIEKEAKPDAVGKYLVVYTISAVPAKTAYYGTDELSATYSITKFDLAEGAKADPETVTLTRKATYTGSGGTAGIDYDSDGIEWGTAYNKLIAVTGAETGDQTKLLNILVNAFNVQGADAKSETADFEINLKDAKRLKAKMAATDPDVYEVVYELTGKNNYKGSLEMAIDIKATDASGATCTVSPTKPVFTGGKIEPDVKVVLGDKTLVEGTDYDLEYPEEEITEVGDQTITVKYKGFYKEETVLTNCFTVQQAPASKLADIEDVEVLAYPDNASGKIYLSTMFDSTIEAGKVGSLTLAIDNPATKKVLYATPELDSDGSTITYVTNSSLTAGDEDTITVTAKFKNYKDKTFKVKIKAVEAKAAIDIGSPTLSYGFINRAITNAPTFLKDTDIKVTKKVNSQDAPVDKKDYTITKTWYASANGTAFTQISGAPTAATVDGAAGDKYMKYRLVVGIDSATYAADPKSFDFTIAPFNLNDTANASKIDFTLKKTEYTYDGTTITPESILKIDFGFGAESIDADDYTVTGGQKAPGNNLDATLSAETNTNYSSSGGTAIKKKFTIKKAPLNIALNDMIVNTNSNNSNDYIKSDNVKLFDSTPAKIGLVSGDSLNTLPTLTYVDGDGNALAVQPTVDETSKIPTTAGVYLLKASAAAVTIGGGGGTWTDYYEPAYGTCKIKVLGSGETLETDETVYEVQLVIGNDAPVSYTFADAGKTIEEPQEDGILGWYRDAAYKKAWNFTKDTVNKKDVDASGVLTLYGKKVQSLVSTTVNDAIDGIATAANVAIQVQDIPDAVYNGKAYKPTPVVSLINTENGIETTLKSGTHYTVTWDKTKNSCIEATVKNNGTEFTEPADPYKLVVTFKKHKDVPVTLQNQEMEVFYNIRQAVIDNSAIKYTESYKIGRDGKASVKPITSIKVGSKTLKPNVDFKYEVQDEYRTTVPAGTFDYSKLGTGKLSLLPNTTGKYDVVITATEKTTGNADGNYVVTAGPRTFYVQDTAKLVSGASIKIDSANRNVKLKLKTNSTVADPTGTKIDFSVVINKVTYKYDASTDTFTNTSTNAPEAALTAAWANNTSIGKATVTVTGDGVKFFGSKSATFTIKEHETLKASYIDDGFKEKLKKKSFSYNGLGWDIYDIVRDIYLNTNLIDSNELVQGLEYNVDYYIVYTKNVDAGTATMTFIAKPGTKWKGSFKMNFKITPIDLCNIAVCDPEDGGTPVVAVDDVTFTKTRDLEYDYTGLLYSKGGKKTQFDGRPLFYNTESGRLLVEKTDYTVSYKGNDTKKGQKRDCYATIQGKGNYKGKTKIKVYFEPRAIIDNVVNDNVIVY